MRGVMLTRVFSVIIFYIMFSNGVIAQIGIGIQLGANINTRTNYNYNDFIRFEGDPYKYNEPMQLSYNIGVLLDYKLSDRFVLSFAPGYTEKKYKLDFEGIDPSEISKMRFFKIPVRLMYNFYDSGDFQHFIQGGFGVEIFSSGKGETEGVSESKMHSLENETLFVCELGLSSEYLFNEKFKLRLTALFSHSFNSYSEMRDGKIKMLDYYLTAGILYSL